MNTLPLILFLALLFLNMPVAIAIAAGALLFFLQQDGLPLAIYAQRFAASSGSFPLVAIPMFTLAGVVMNHAGITERLLNLAEVLVGHTVGALAKANVVLATLIGGLSASANADAAMQSKMLGTEMIRRGYRPDFSASVIASSAVIVPILPPALGFIIYGHLANVSVARLFIAGIIPGVMIAAALLITTHYLSKRHGYRPIREKRARPREIFQALKSAIWALTVPVFIIVGLRSGVFTPTESGVMTLVYSLVIGFFIHRKLRVSMLPSILTEAMLASAGVMLIISAADAFSFYLTLEQIPSRAAETLIQLTDNPWIMLLLINGFLLLIGLILESVAGLILLTPILLPVVLNLGIDPVHFGLIISLNFTIGALTPPVGTLMFIVCGTLNVRISDFTRAVLPFLAVLIGILLCVTYIPGIVTFLPDLLMD